MSRCSQKGSTIPPNRSYCEKVRGGFIRSVQHPVIWEVAVPSGVPVSRAVKREFFDLVCLGMATTEASEKVGVSRRTGWFWWRDAGAMKLCSGYGGRGGLASPGELC